MSSTVIIKIIYKENNLKKKTHTSVRQPKSFYMIFVGEKIFCNISPREKLKVLSLSNFVIL